MRFRLLILYVALISSFGLILNPLYSSMISSGWFTTKVQINDDGFGRSHHDLYSSGQRVIFASGEDVFLVWSDNRFGDQDVFFANSANKGDHWSENIKINDTPIGDQTDQRSPSIVVSESEEIYVVWSDTRYGTFQIFFAKSDDGGLTFFPNVPIGESLPLNHSQEFPTLAMDSNQNLFVAWKEVSPDLGDDKFSGRIYFSKSMDDGISWMEKIIVDGSVPVRSAQQNPNMIVDDSDNIYIAWMDTRRGNPDIFFSKSQDGGITWEESAWVSEAFSGRSWEIHPSIGIDAVGNLYIAYTHTPYYDIFVAKSFDGGENWSSIRVDNTRRRYTANLNPSLAVNADGIIAVVWSDTRHSRWRFPPPFQLPGYLKYKNNYDIFIGVSSDQGESFTNLKVSDSFNKDFEFFPSVSLNETGEIFIAWQGLTQGNNNIYFSRSQADF